jgi:hypothetical protein
MAYPSWLEGHTRIDFLGIQDDHGTSLKLPELKHDREPNDKDC